MNSQKLNNKCCSKKKKKVLWSTTKSCTRSSHPDYVRNSLLGQCQPSASSSLPSGGFYLTVNNTNSHFQGAEENGSAGKWSTSKPGKELNTALENTVQGGDRNSKRGVNWSVEVGTPRILGTLAVCQAMGVFLSWKPKWQLSAVVTRMLCATSVCVTYKDLFHVLFPLLA